LKYQETEEEWVKESHEYALYLVQNVNWPWTERQKRLWYIGVLAGLFDRKSLEEADINQLQDWHKEVTK